MIAVRTWNTTRSAYNYLNSVYLNCFTELWYSYYYKLSIYSKI